MKLDLKQISIGALIGAFAMFSSQAAADTISKVGKKVQGEVVVKVDGVTLNVKGLVIDGQTTVPARALADASGLGLAFENKEVLLTTKNNGGESVIHEKALLQSELNIVNGDIEGVEFFIRRSEGQLITGSFGSEQEKVNTEKQLSEYKTRLESLQKKKAELETQLGE